MSAVSVQFSSAGLLPLDYRSALHGALSASVPGFHGSGTLVRGFSGRVHGSHLVLDARSRLELRVREPDLLTALLDLRRLEVAGEEVLLGCPRLAVLRPAPRLRARLVVYRGATSAAEVERRVRRDLESMGASAATVTAGPRRSVRVHDLSVSGNAVTLEGLAPEASVAVQARGLGGRAAYGCGFFLEQAR